MNVDKMIYSDDMIDLDEIYSEKRINVINILLKMNIISHENIKELFLSFCEWNNYNGIQTICFFNQKNIEWCKSKQFKLSRIDIRALINRHFNNKTINV